MKEKNNKKFSKDLIEQNIQTVYDLSNSILYDMCRNNFNHDSINKILAKTIIIGRTYSAALDRGRQKNSKLNSNKNINDDFYQKKVVPLFINSKLDKYLRYLSIYSTADHACELALEIHGYLTKRMRKINKQNKRSFASKYLHFHYPELFFLYDSRANKAINSLVSSRDISKLMFKFKKIVDRTYGIYYLKCLYLQNKILEDEEVLLSPRQLDNLLLRIANKKLRSRLKEMLAKNK